MRVFATLDSATVDIASHLYDNSQDLLERWLTGNAEDKILKCGGAQRAEGICGTLPLLVAGVLVGWQANSDFNKRPFARRSRELGCVHNVGDHQMSPSGLRRGGNVVAQQRLR